MKLLILAQTPPPLHGQSLMVDTAVRGLPDHGIEIAHVNLRLSRGHADIGGWRAGKLLAILDACFHALVVRFTTNCDTLYYVPAPGKRGALYRDWLVMALCRPFFRRLVLHFHSGGLGEWLGTRATPMERAFTHRLLGHADLAVVLADSLRSDATALGARKIVVVPNGIVVPTRIIPFPVAQSSLAALFLGECSREKGVLDAVAAIQEANRRRPGRFRLTVAGACPDRAVANELRAAEASSAGAIRFIGFAGPETKATLWQEHDCLLFPTRYAHEGQPLVILEALGHGCRVIATRWRAIPTMLPAGGGRLTTPWKNCAPHPVIQQRCATM
jgi:glycosyltransferase involved in cell wall biosynthesis